MAVLKGDGKVDSSKQRLMRVVIGCARESRQDLRTRVGIKSRLQVASDDARIASLTSSVVARVK
jgi:hypothetical protein